KKAVTLTGKAVKELGWDNRGLSGRLGIATAIATVVVFGGQGAGIAALGTAIGVPLWVVFGAGAAFLGEVYEKFTGKRRHETTYTVIDAKRKRDDASQFIQADVASQRGLTQVLGRTRRRRRPDRQGRSGCGAIGRASWREGVPAWGVEV